MSSQKQTIQFSSLPQEIRDEIWTLTLPSRRIFDLERCYDNEQDRCYFQFQNRNPLPITLQICRDSREAALRQGFFFTPLPSNKSVYFIPQTDILYFNPVECQRLKEQEPPICMPGLDRVLNVGFEWTSFFEYDHDRSIAKEETYWRRVVQCLYIEMPHLKTINHISPMPMNKPHCEYALTPLPEDTRVSWRGADIDEEYEDVLWLVTWRDVKGYVEHALEESERRPEILGWKLYATSIGPKAFSSLFRVFLRSS